MNIKNEAQLRKFLTDKCTKAVSSAEAIVYKELKANLDNFYSEFNPEEYIRTYALLNSLEATGIKKSGNQHMSSIKAEVHFNTPSYEQGLMELQHTPEHGMYGWSTLTGEEVLDITMKNSRPHGGHISGTPIWTRSMKNLGGKNGIKNLIKQEIQKQGL